jgi:hypothetical protein
MMTYMEGNHSLRTPEYQFMRYRDGGMELYDMRKDPQQERNLAKDTAAAPLVQRFIADLDGRVKDEVKGNTVAPTQE